MTGRRPMVIFACMVASGVAGALTFNRADKGTQTNARENLLSRPNPHSISIKAHRHLKLSENELRRCFLLLPFPAPPIADNSYCLHWLRLSRSRKNLHRIWTNDDIDNDSNGIVSLFLKSDLGRGFFGLSPLIRTREGLRFVSDRTSDTRYSTAAEVHRDQCLATMAELGVSLDAKCYVNEETLTLRHGIMDSIGAFYLGQNEIEWTAIAYAMYLDQPHWSNRFGERFSFDDVALELLRRPLHSASCFGQHIIYALVVLSQVDDKSPVLSAHVRTQVDNRLKEILSEAIISQHTDGYWDLNWNTSITRNMSSWRRPENATLERILITGHMLDWMIRLPGAQEMPRERLASASKWLVSVLESTSESTVLKNYCPYSHAIRCVLELSE